MGCLCPGESLTYECTVLGEHWGATVWTGNTFNCTSREISLLHWRYESTEGAYGECGDIMGHSLRVNITMDSSNPIEYYVSQVTFPVTSNTAGRIIECLHDSGAIVVSVGQATIATTKGD